MSMELHVLLQDTRVPTVTEWQQAIREAGFDLLLDSSLRLREDTGFSPAVYRGNETGFEFDLWPASDITDTYPDVASRIGGRDMAANFRWGGDLLECAAAVIAAAALARLTDGVLFDPQEGDLASGDEAIEMARQETQEIDRSLA
jgi:hypothetical protein